MDLSIVIPLYDECESVKPLVNGIVEAVEPLDLQFEVLLVDDGSTDGTFDRACEVTTQDDRFRVIKLRNNFGQTTALDMGLKHARGGMIVTMDGDLQNDPEDIGRLVDKMRDGYDLVAGYRENRKDRFLLRTLPSVIANWLIRKVMGTSILDNGCALRAYRASVIEKIPLYSEMHRLLPTIFALAGTQIAQIPVRHHPRKYGESKYGLARIYKVLIDLLVLKSVITASRFPLFGFGIIAVVSAGLGGLTLLAGLRHIVSVPETTLVVYLGATFLWGTLSLSLLMLGALASMIYTRADVKVDDLLEMEVID